MDARETTQDQYASFLVRLWRSAEPRPNGSTDEWHGEVEHIQSGRRWRLGSPAELWEFLSARGTDSPAVSGEQQIAQDAISV